MNISQFCIKKPVFTIVLTILIIILGVIGYLRINITGYPNISNPEIGIHTTLDGASSSYMADQVSSIIENSISTITGIDSVESNSQDGVSDVIVNFAPGVNLDAKMNEISNNLSQVNSQLPKGIVGPTINQANPNSTPIISLFFYDEKMSTPELSDYINRYIKPSLEKLSGIAQIPMNGDKSYAVRIWLNPAKMATLHVTIDDVINALADQNIQSQTGQLKTTGRIYALIPDARVADIKDFNQLVVAHYAGNNIHIKDIATVALGTNEK